MSDEASDVQTGLCDGVDGCGGYFSRKTTPGLCGQCALIFTFESQGKSDRAAEIRCQECGAAGKNFKNDVCGICARGREPASDPRVLASQAVQDMANVRALATEHRGLSGHHRPMAPPIPRYPAPSAPTPTMPPPPPPSFEPSRPAIQGRNISISFQPAVSTKKDGKVSFLATLVHVLQDVLDMLNVLWEKKTSKGLARTDISIRFPGNILPEGDTENETLGDFYDRHHSAQHRNGYFGKVPQELKHIKTPLINVVLFIDVAMWEDRTGMPSPTRTEKELLQWTRAQEKKRPGSSLVNSAAKRLRTTVPRFESMYIPYSRKPTPVMPTTKVVLQLAKLRINTAGQFHLSWKDETCEATVADNFFAHGATKRVYKVKLTQDGMTQNCVGKRFFQIGQGEDQVSCSENLNALECDAERLYKGTYFLNKFYETATERGVEVFERFEFSHCALAREVLDSENSASCPSPACGILSDQWSDAGFSEQDAGVVWLVEPERSAAVERWSGTMEHPNHHNKRGATLVAFVHYAYVYSHRTEVFADLQTSSGKLKSGMRGDILFDVMTHTTSGTSGIGDHGEAGIKKFLSDHTCNGMCRELGLRDISDPLEDRDRILTRHDQDKYDTESESESEDDDDMLAEARTTTGSGRRRCRAALVGYESSQEDEEEAPADTSK
ncbi:hypothetical protein GSI_05922 [Ganoderma sinense ZZ0214-1]|uniref:Alpha-type protein kinase domain-containing protein n=1 Tax=Ganoderma sinense ZZ0214-1 TaxID=1077348 RepID=A0A2G8SBT4_9APHY|nr:hypothetical protein GSI_05922 [Ganoderma sinense ZZ0214-1]